MKLPKELTTVTPLSKTVALIMFISLPIITFLFGMQYQMMLTEQKGMLPPVETPIEIEKPIRCQEDAKICPDGTAVGRIAPDCEFEECPVTQIDGAFCGGIAGKLCPANYYCKYEGSYPDAGGTCIRTGNTIPTTKKTTFICPKTQYVDCMPGSPGQPKDNCSSEYLQWAQTNCPGFQGAAY